MFFESNFDQREVMALMSLVGKTFQYIENSTSENFRLTSGVRVVTSDQQICIYSDYWYPATEDPALKYFELARFEVASEFPRKGAANEMHFRQAFGGGQEVKGVFILKAKYSNVEFPTASYQQVGSSDKATFEYTGSISAKVAFAFDAALVLVLEETVVCFRFENPWFELFDVEHAGSIDEIKVVPYSGLFESEIQPDQFGFEWIPIESLAARF
jgi:hypothetical protein